MASLVQDLIGILEEETGCYELLRDMADNKKEVIIKGDLPSLQDMTQREQEMAGQLLRLEKERLTVIEDIATVTNQNKDSITVYKLIEMLKDQPEHEKLKEVGERLVAAVEPLKKANQINESLLKQSLDYIDFTMNALHSSKEAVVTNNYGSNKGYNRGYGNGGYGGSSLFDSKQ